LGGKMAVAQAIYSRKQREAMSKILGPECVFIVLNMSRDCQKKRIIARHGEDMNENALAFLFKMAEMYEPAGEDEENAYNCG
jgi:gluconate kinase